jgi:ABC-type transport system involved in multi-copper enzyme maturation permease subunit
MKSLARSIVVAVHTYREATRQRVIYALLAVAAVLTTAGLLLKELTIRQEAKILQDLGLATTEFIATAVAVFLSCDLLSREIEQKTVHTLLTTHLRRGEFLVGRFIGLGLTLTSIVTVMLLATTLALAVSGHRASAGLVTASYATLLGVWLLASLGVLLSALGSRAVALVGTIATAIVGRLTDTLLNLRELLPDVPEWIGRFLYFVVPNFRNFDLKNRVVYGDPISLDLVVGISGYAAIYTTLLLVLAVWSFEKRDLP